MTCKRRKKSQKNDTDDDDDARLCFATDTVRTVFLSLYERADKSWKITILWMYKYPVVYPRSKADK